MIVLIVLNHLTTTNYLSGSHKYAKCGQLYVKILKISIFDQFFDFDCLNLMDLLDYDTANGFGLFDNHKLPGWSAQLCEIRPIRRKIFFQFLMLK